MSSFLGEENFRLRFTKPREGWWVCCVRGPAAPAVPARSPPSYAASYPRIYIIYTVDLYIFTPDKRIRIRILLFSSVTFKMPKKNIFAYYFLNIHLHRSSKIKVIKNSQKTRVEMKVYLTIFAWWWKDPV